MNIKSMVEEFQCPGCVNGNFPETCEQYAYSKIYYSCTNQELGTVDKSCWRSDGF